MTVIRPNCDFGWSALISEPTGTNGITHGFHDLAGNKGTVVVFIRNHCPYAFALLNRLEHDA